MKSSLYKNENSFTLQLNKESKDTQPDFLTMVILLVLFGVLFYLGNGLVKFIMAIGIIYDISRYIAIKLMDSSKTSFIPDKREFITENYHFPLEDAGTIEITRVHELSWKVFKPNFAKAQDKHRGGRRNNDGDMIFLILGGIFEIIVYGFRKLLFLIKKPAYYLKLSLLFTDGYEVGFSYTRTYSEPDITQISQALTEWTGLPVNNKEELIKIGFLEFLNKM